MQTVPEMNDHRRRAADTKRRRSEAALLASAKGLFADPSHCWSGTRMDDIAAGAGLSLATAYTYFKNKSALMGPVCRPYYEELEKQLEADLERVPALDAAVRLVKNMSAFVRKNVTLTVALLTAVREQSEREPNLSDDEPRIFDFVPFSELMVRALSQAQQNSEVALAPGEVRDIALYHTNALLLRVFVGPPTESPDELARLVLSQLLPALGITGKDALHARLEDALPS
ncbi:MAG: regulatory protein TetR [Streptosporangiaceae bacterium]|nr:regulatory protein TetR [Streptosporangiaceae bacterium]